MQKKVFEDDSQQYGKNNLFDANYFQFPCKRSRVLHSNRRVPVPGSQLLNYVNPAQVAFSWEPPYIPLHLCTTSWVDHILCFSKLLSD